MGDSDNSYDFANLDRFVEKLREGYDVVMGNRFRGGIAEAAMPPLHRYLGNPVLSFVGRLFFRSPIGDFHCGLRGFSREAVLGLELDSSGMEFASEMVVKATLAELKITEVPTTLSPDGRSRPPHLRSWRDGWRHLKLLLEFAPHWLFLYPGGALASMGTLLAAALIPGPLEIGDLTLDARDAALRGRGDPRRHAARALLCGGEGGGGRGGASAGERALRAHERLPHRRPLLPGRRRVLRRRLPDRGGRGHCAGW